MNDVDKPWFALRQRNLAREKRARGLHWAGVATKVLAIAAFILVTNFGFLDRVSLLAQNGRWATLLPFLAVWTVCVAALYVAAFQPRFFVRALWAIPIALSTACAWSYFEASKSDLSVFDVVSLWSARHEASRAAEFYSSQIVTALIVFGLGFLVIASPPAPAGRIPRLWLSRLAWAPIVPIVVIAAIIVMKQGGGSQALPKQFAPLALPLSPPNDWRRKAAPTAVQWNGTRRRVRACHIS